jgi:hypothetical protein
MKKFKISPTEPEDQLYTRWEQYQQSRVIEQKEEARKAEIELLDSAPTVREYIKRRDAQKFLVVEPNIPLDEMTPSDYMKVRARQEDDREPELRIGEKSYKEFRKEREANRG